MHYEFKGKTGWIENTLSNIIDKKAKRMLKDDDLVIAVTGAERVGKSEFVKNTLAPFIAQCLGVDYSVDNIHFNIEEYMKASLNGINGKVNSITKKKTLNQINILDESRRELNRSKSTSKNNTSFMDYLSECGELNQVHIILLPSHVDLDKYLIDWRMDMHIEVRKIINKVTKEEERGHLRVINHNHRVYKDLYLKKVRKIPDKLTVINAKFTKNDFIDEIEYKKKKDKFRLEKFVNQIEENDKKDSKFSLTKREMEVLTGFSPAKCYKHNSTEYRILHNVQKKCEKALFS